jgi:toxin ParE1/3/4
VPKALELHFSPQAERDIDRIYDYTEDEWGTQQAEKYTTELRLACEKLISSPKSGRSASHIRIEYSVLGCGSHNIFFREERTRIVIVRILHQRMDFKRHL